MCSNQRSSCHGQSYDSSYGNHEYSCRNIIKVIYKQQGIREDADIDTLMEILEGQYGDFERVMAEVTPLVDAGLEVLGDDGVRRRITVNPMLAACRSDSVMAIRWMHIRHYVRSYHICGGLHALAAFSPTGC